MPLFIFSRFTNTTHNTTTPHLLPPPPPPSSTPNSTTPPPGTDPKTNVQSKDVTINATTGAAASLYLPPRRHKASSSPSSSTSTAAPSASAPPFNPPTTTTSTPSLAAANVVVVSVHYRLAPEAPIPTCYDDSWEVVKWADLGAVFFAGDSAAGNIAHNMRGGVGGAESGGDGAAPPYFGNEQKDELVAYLYPTYEGPTNLMIHSTMDPKISNLGCPRVLIFVSEKDFLRDRGCAYHDALTKSGWKGKVDIVQFAGEDHVFHLFAPTKDNSFCS
ncbi:hypothetical protein Fmac_014714 [Flemingia macrophylla]|uniref:Alpha/beta hydrolase fold-3 domain-containing protein n=1 Tax=Flemingia macrophylla TaxID=520843 RepID=A0ABD1MCH7_9FABA